MLAFLFLCFLSYFLPCLASLHHTFHSFYSFFSLFGFVFPGLVSFRSYFSLYLPWIPYLHLHVTCPQALFCRFVMTSLAMITFFLPRTAVLILVFSGRDGFSLVLPIKSAFLSLVLHILRSGSADVKTLQRLSGKCISFSLAIPAARLFLNDINIAIGKGIWRSQPWSYVKPLAAPGSMLCLMTTKSYRQRMQKGRREELRWKMNTKAFGLIIEYSSGEGFCQTQRTSSN